MRGVDLAVLAEFLRLGGVLGDLRIVLVDYLLLLWFELGGVRVHLLAPRVLTRDAAVALADEHVQKAFSLHLVPGLGALGRGERVEVGAQIVALDLRKVLRRDVPLEVVVAPGVLEHVDVQAAEVVLAHVWVVVLRLAAGPLLREKVALRALHIIAGRKGSSGIHSFGGLRSKRRRTGGSGWAHHELIEHLSHRRHGRRSVEVSRAAAAVRIACDEGWLCGHGFNSGWRRQRLRFFARLPEDLGGISRVWSRAPSSSQRPTGRPASRVSGRRPSATTPAARVSRNPHRDPRGARHIASRPARHPRRKPNGRRERL